MKLRNLLKRTPCPVVLGGALLIGLGSLAPPAKAGFIVTLEQMGSDVVATGSGPIDLTGLGLFSNRFNFVGPSILPHVPNVGDFKTGLISTGSETNMNTVLDLYGTATFTNPGSFGSGGGVNADRGSGDFVGTNLIVNPGIQLGIMVPGGYISDSPLSGTATYDNQTFASLGVEPGTYEWTWGTGPNQNFTLDIVPEPASLALFASALLGLGFLARRKQIAALCRDTQPLHPSPCCADRRPSQPR